MLVNRWGILRRALPAAMNMNRTLLLTMALCRLHNFCINERLKHKEGGRLTVRRTLRIAEPLAIDVAEIATHGGIPMENRADRDVPRFARNLPEQLLHAGHHHDDTERDDRRRLERYARRRAQDGLLPRDILHNMIIAQQLRRPEPNQWQKQKENEEFYNV
jgi:hypothetical protein